MRILLILLLFLGSGAALRAEDNPLLIDVGESEQAFTARFNEGVGRVRFLAIVSPG